MLGVIMLGVFMLRVGMLNVGMLNVTFSYWYVVMLSVTFPY
jgi:hypothetical protein